MELHWVPANSGILGNKEADPQVNIAQEDNRSSTIVQP